MDELPVGEAENPKTQPLKMGVSSAVALEGGAVSVVSPRVGLDHQRAIAPEEVDLVGAEPGIHLRLGKAVAAPDAQEQSLELAASEVGFADLVGPDQPEVERSTNSATVHRLGNGAAQVLERACRLGHRDALAAGRNTGNEGGGAVNPDSAPLLSAAVTRNRDIDEPG